MLLGFAAEIYWHGNVLWMTGRGIAGGIAGAICDTALFLYRRQQRKRMSEKALRRSTRDQSAWSCRNQ